MYDYVTAWLGGEGDLLRIVKEFDVSSYWQILYALIIIYSRNILFKRIIQSWPDSQI